MSNRTSERFDRYQSDRHGTSQPVVITNVHEGGVSVDVAPLQQKSDAHTPVDVLNVPVLSITGAGFHTPLKAGMVGQLINSTREISETGVVSSRSSNSDFGGHFIPTNSEAAIDGFLGFNIGAGKVGFQDGKLVVINEAGVDVLAAISEISSHLRSEESIIFVDSGGKTHTHSGAKDRQADEL